jgi:putative ABC transport system ATP-binding protein
VQETSAPGYAHAEVQPSVLRIEGLTKSYGGIRARELLRGLSLELLSGEFVAIMGESGSGKSTLLNLIAGLDLPDAGRIVFDGVDITRLDDRERTLLRRARMGFVFQAFHLLPHLTVLQNVSLPLDLDGLASAAATSRASAMLEAVGLEKLGHDYPHTLSGGEAQRVAIARALVNTPALLLADEPTGNLDSESAGEVLSLLRGEVKRRAGSGILVTHSHAAARIADRVYLLGARGLVLTEL